jgi:phosphate-selective porin OprO and OprP
VNTRWTCCFLSVLVVSMAGPTALAQEALAPGPGPAGKPTPPASLGSPVPAAPPGIAIGPSSSPPDAANVPHPDNDVLVSTPQRQKLLLQASWENGFQLESDKNDFKLHVGGLGMIDTVFLIGPQSLFAAPGGGTSGVGNAQATQIRRAILQADGTIFDQFDFSIEFDFANASNDNSGLQPPSFGNLTSSPAPLNVWMQIRDVPVLGHVRIGNQTKTIGMENITSAAFLPFMERSDNMDAFYGPFDNGFSLGITANSWTESERVTWRYGVYQPETNVFGVALDKYVVGARVTALPIYEEEGQRLIHLGLGYWGGELVQDQNRDRVRPLLRNAPGFAVPVLADTAEIPGNKQYTIGPEFALVLGPFTVQAEWAAQFLTHAIVSGQDQGTVFFHGGYVEALYFLTGEHQPYDKREGVFGRVVPLHDYHVRKNDCIRGLGAWQVGVRFSYVDLTDKAVQGGEIYDWTVGLNWYLNSNMKFQLNYILEHRDMPNVAQGWINGIGLRAAYDF